MFALQDISEEYESEEFDDNCSPSDEDDNTDLNTPDNALIRPPSVARAVGRPRRTSSDSDVELDEMEMDNIDQDTRHFYRRLRYRFR